MKIPEGFPFRIYDQPMWPPADEILEGWRVKYHVTQRGEKYPKTEWTKCPEVFPTKDECLAWTIRFVLENPNISRLVVVAYEKGVQYSLIDGFRGE